MKNLQELYNAYILKSQEERRINERIVDRQLQIKRLENKKRKLTGWIDNLVKPLAEILTPLLECEKYEILGPFGLRAETSIWFKKPNSTATHCDYRLCLTVETSYHKNYTYKGEYCSPVMSNVYLQYDSVNQHERIQDVIREIIQNFSLIEGTDETQFDDGNIPRAKPNGDCFILRACMKGRVKKQDGVININGRFYRPQKGR